MYIKRLSISSVISLLVALIIASTSIRAESLQRIELPAFEKKSLLNGMQVLFFDGNPGRIPFVLMIANGAAFDPVDKWGATNLMVEMMLERTQQATGRPVREGLAAYGAELHFRTGWDAIFFFGSTPPEHLGSVLATLADIVIRPAFDEEIFQRTRDRLLLEVEAESAGVENQTQALFKGRLFAGNPYGHSVKGTLGTLQNLFLRDIKIQYKRLVLPNQAQLAVYAPRDRDRLLQELSRSWGVWIKDQPAPFTFRQAADPKSPTIYLLDAPQEESLFRWGRLGIEKSSPDFHALKVFEQYLTLSLTDWASEVTASRQIRASVQLEARKMPGYVQLSIKAPPDQLVPYFEKFRTLLDRVQKGLVETERLAEAQSLVLQDFLSNLQDPLQRLFEVLEADLFGLGINHITTYGLRLERVIQ